MRVRRVEGAAHAEAEQVALWVTVREDGQGPAEEGLRRECREL